ncbi:hypothetical protein B0T13DRAFT_329005 [Neurospora crassa]|nr:hypothetical protein B0T13DRAFT_329005 [Neurospora crassa]
MGSNEMSIVLLQILIIVTRFRAFGLGGLTAYCSLSSLADDLVSTPPALLLPCRPFSKHEPNVNKQTKNGNRQQKTTN